MLYHDSWCPRYAPKALRHLPWYLEGKECRCGFEPKLVYEDDDCWVFHGNSSKDHGFVVHWKRGDRLERIRQSIEGRHGDFGLWAYLEWKFSRM